MAKSREEDLFAAPADAPVASDVAGPDEPPRDSADYQRGTWFNLGAEIGSEAPVTREIRSETQQVVRFSADTPVPVSDYEEVKDPDVQNLMLISGRTLETLALRHEGDVCNGHMILMDVHSKERIRVLPGEKVPAGGPWVPVNHLPQAFLRSSAAGADPKEQGIRVEVER